MDGDGMEALGFLGDAGLGAIEADGGGGVSGGFGVGDLAGQDDAALDGFSEHGLAGLGMLIPAEGFAGQEGVAEPFERDEGVAAAFGFGQCRTELFDTGVQVGGNLRFLAVVVLVLLIVVVQNRADRSGGTGTWGVAIVYAFEVDADLVFFGRPGFGRSVAALAAAVLAA